MFVNSKIALVIQPELLPMFEEIAIAKEVKYQVTSNDLQKIIDAERPKKQRKAFTLDDYNTLEEIYEYLDEVERTNPFASVFTVGESYENRLIKGLKISTSESNPAIFIEANIHARGKSFLGSFF